MRYTTIIAALWMMPWACPAATLSSLEGAIAAKDHRAAVLAEAARDPSWFQRGCETSNFEIVAGHKLWGAPSFGADAKLVAGEWSEQVRAAGCGVTRLLNVDSVATAGGITLRRLLPGFSRAAPELQDKAAARAWAAATAWNPPGCKDDFIDDTAVIGHHEHDAAAWSERWTLRVCRQPIVVVVDYRILYAGDDVRAHRVTRRYSNELAHPPATP